MSGKKIISLSGLIAAALLTGCAGAPSPAGVPNLASVAPGIYRGGQPTPAGWQYLHDRLGVRYVVKLNEWPASPAAPASDDPGLDTGMIVLGDEITFPEQMFPHNQVFLPSEIILALAFIHDHPAGVFIHCEQGQDRTGLIVACYRLECGWSKADAEKEMLAHGFHRELAGLWGTWRWMTAAEIQSQLK